MKQAKIVLSMDVKPLQRDIGKARDIIKTLGPQLKAIFNQDLKDQIKVFQSHLNSVTNSLNHMAKAGKLATDSLHIKDLIRQYAALNQAIQATIRSQTQMMGGQGGGGGAPREYPVPHLPGQAPPMVPPTAPRMRGRRGGGGGGRGGSSGPIFNTMDEEGGGGRSMNPVGAAARGGSKVLGAIGIGVGIGGAVALFERAVQIAEGNLRTRQITAGATVRPGSALGFTNEERRERGFQVASGAGRNLSSAQLTQGVNQSELMERAYGIGGGEYGAAMKSFRRNGEGFEGQQKGVASVIGDAVAMKLEGSEIGEYLGMMSKYLEEMSKGVSVDDKSLRGFASSLGTIPFFKGNPERIFDTIGKMDALYKGGGTPFQQLQTYSAIQGQAQQSGLNIGPSGVSVRQSVGMFGGKGLGAEFNKAGMKDLGKLFETSGPKAMEEMLVGLYKSSKGMNNIERANLFQQNGIGGEAGLRLMAHFGQQEKAGQPLHIGTGDMKAIAEANKSPEDRLSETFKNFDGSVVALKAQIEGMKDELSKPVAQAALGLSGAVTKLDDTLNKWILKLLGEDSTTYGKQAEAATRDALKQGIALHPDVASGIGEELDSAAQDLRGPRAHKMFGQDHDYDSLTPAQKAAVDNDIDQQLDKRRKRLIQGAISKKKALDRYSNTERGADFIPGTPEEKKLLEGMSDDADANKANLDSFNTGEITNPDAFFDGQSGPPKARMRGGFITLAGGGKVKDTVDVDADGNKVVNSAGNKRAAAFFKDAWAAVVGEGDDFSENAAKYRKKHGSGSKQYGGVIGYKKGGIVQKVLDFVTGTSSAAATPKRKKTEAELWQEKLDHAPSGPGVPDAKVPSIIDVMKTTSWKDVKEVLGHASGGHVGASSIKGFGRRRRAMGTDTIDAALTPGEFVVNARDSASNMFALMHANAGGKIVPAADGGVMGGSFPSSITLDSGSHEAAVGANTQALHALAYAIGGSVQRQAPRGARMRYG